MYSDFSLLYYLDAIEIISLHDTVFTSFIASGALQTNTFIYIINLIIKYAFKVSEQ